MFLNYMQQNRSIVQKLGHPVEEKIYKGYIEKTQKNRKIALNQVQFTHFRKISVKKIDSTSCGSLMAKNIGQDLQLQPKKAKSGLFSAFRGLDFKEFPLSDQNSKKTTYLRFKEVLLQFFELMVCLHWFNTEMGRFWPKFQFRFRQQYTLVLITVFYR